MSDKAKAIVQKLPAGPQLNLFANRLRAWLLADLNAGDDVAEFTESRAKALLRAMDVLDDPTRNSFERLLASEGNLRLLLHDMLTQSELDENDEVSALAAASGASDSEAEKVDWLSLLIAATAWKRGYPLHQLDPSSPPGEHSPAGQVVRNAAQLIRQQVVRSATERDKLLRTMAQPVESIDADEVPSLDELDADGTAVADPTVYRPPIPVNYPEFTNETLDIEPVENVPTPPERGEEILITEADIAAAPPSWDEQPAVRIDPLPPERLPEIRITREQVTPPPPPPSPLPRSGVILPQSSHGMGPQTRPNLLMALMERFGANQEMSTTRLRVIVKTHPDGPGMQALQVNVSCRGIRSQVSGTTNRNGRFLCELPVPVDKGITYDVDVTWPREMGGDIERKSVTLHDDRTEFELPFYMNLYKS